MNSYQILGINENASDEEVLRVYEDLKRMYDPSVNTSSSAYSKYRQIIAAYELIKTKKERDLYNLELKEKEKRNKLIITKPDIKNYSLFDFSNFKKEEEKIDEISDYKDIANIAINEELSKEISNNFNIKHENIIVREVDFLDFYFSTTQKFNLNVKIPCKNCLKTYLKCNTCHGLGFVQFNNDYINCPICLGSGELEKSSCTSCNNKTYIYENITFNLKLNNNQDLFQQFIFPEYNNLKINFIVKQKDNVQIKNKEVFINYELDEQQRRQGFTKIYVLEEQQVYVNIKPFLEEKFVKTIKFEKINVTFTFYSKSFEGRNIEQYFLFPKKDLYKNLYLDPLTMTYKLNQDDIFFENIKITSNPKHITIKQHGLPYIGEGINGDLILRPIIVSKRLPHNKYIHYDKKIINTSLMFNLFGGKIENVFHFGFGFKNHLKINNDKKEILILTGNNQNKVSLSSYFIFKILFYIIWLGIFLLFFILPFNKSNLVTLLIIWSSYTLFANVIIRLKV